MNTNDFSGERQAFCDAYDDTLAFLEARMAANTITLTDLEGEFYHLTVYEGQDWDGRGMLKSAEIQGQISAYITVIDELKSKA